MHAVLSPLPLTPLPQNALPMELIPGATSPACPDHPSHERPDLNDPIAHEYNSVIAPATLPVDLYA